MVVGIRQFAKSHAAFSGVVARGEEDALMPAAVVRAMHQQIPRSSLATLPETGYLANIEQPAAFNALHSQFLGHFQAS